MRTFIAAIAFSLLTQTSAFAQAAAPAPAGDAKATTPAQPGTPAEAPKLLGKSPERPNSFLIKDAPLPGDYVMGKQNAPVLLIEYASLSCPHCAHFSTTVLPELQSRYIDTGKMRYILRQFPLNEPALKGAMLVDCVGEQDKSKYFVFSKVLFDAQNKWAFDGNFVSGLETIGAVGGLSKEQVDNCITNTDREMKILKAKKQANDELKIPHTPYMVINGEVYEGERSVEDMSKYIDKLLENTKR